MSRPSRLIQVGFPFLPPAVVPVTDVEFTCPDNRGSSLNRQFLLPPPIAVSGGRRGQNGGWDRTHSERTEEDGMLEKKEEERKRRFPDPAFRSHAHKSTKKEEESGFDVSCLVSSASEPRFSLSDSTLFFRYMWKKTCEYSTSLEGRPVLHVFSKARRRRRLFSLGITCRKHHRRHPT